MCICIDYTLLVTYLVFLRSYLLDVARFIVFPGRAYLLDNDVLIGHSLSQQVELHSFEDMFAAYLCNNLTLYYFLFHHAQHVVPHYA